jgi:hypothetical protein
MIVRAFAVTAFAWVAVGAPALAVDHSAQAAAPPIPAETCCVDAVQLPPIETSDASDDRALLDLNRMAPATALKLGLEEADWSCRWPDGSWRCFSEIAAPR